MIARGLALVTRVRNWYRFLLACVWVPPRTIHRRGPSTFARHIRYSHERKTNHVANIKSQIKRIRTNQKATERNKAVKSEVRSAVRATREAIASGDKDKATTALRVATRKLDKAAGKGVIHKNQAANKKSAIAKQVAAL